MSEKDNRKDADFTGEIRIREHRKIRARKQKSDEVWFGLGTFGMVGWSVAIPTVLGIFSGIWIDRTWPSRYSWTLMLLVIGLAFGCVNTWFWVNRQRRAIGRGREDETG